MDSTSSPLKVVQIHQAFSYGSSIGIPLEEDDELLDELEGALLLELELDELLEEFEELIELLELEELVDELVLEELELLEPEETLLLDEVVLVSCLASELVDSSLEELLKVEVDSSLLEVDSILLSLEDTKLVVQETPVLQADNIKAPNTVIE